MSGLERFAAKKRVKKFEQKMGIGEILTMSAEDLEMEGFTTKEAHLISGAVQMVMEAKQEYTSRRRKGAIRNSREMAEHVSPRCISRQECFWVLGLDVRQHPVFITKIAMGSATEVNLTLSNVIKPVIVKQLPRMAVIHNHPSGDPDPSDADIELTGKIVKACNLMGIELIDHLIITSHGGYTSLADKGYL